MSSAELEQHGGFMRRLADGVLRDESLAEDAVQEAWLAWMQRPAEERQSLKGWLRTVTMNAARRVGRGEGRRRARELAVAKKEPLPSAADVAAREQTMRMVLDGVFGLAEPYRTTVLLRFYEDLPPAVIAEREGVSVNTVNTRLRRALEKLRERFDRVQDRGQWTRSLAAVAGLGFAAKASLGTSAATTTGVLIMSVKTKLALATLLLVPLVIVLKPWDTLPEQADLADDAASLETSVGTTPSGNTNDAREDAISTQAFQRPQRLRADDEPHLAIRVVHADGTPAQRAGIVLVRDDRVLAHGKTDESGKVQLAPHEGTAQVVVVPAEAPLHLDEVRIDAGLATIQLPAGAIVGGRVRVDGRVPAKPLALELYPDRAEVELAHLAQKIRDRIDHSRRQYGRLKARTDAEGRFRFRGLAPGWSGRLVFPPHVKLKTPLEHISKRNALILPAPEAQLEIDLLTLPLVTGRVVFADGSPVPGALVRHKTYLRHGGEFGGGEIADGDGRFRVVLRHARATQKLELDIQTRDETRSRVLAIEKGFERGHDLGDIAFAGTRKVVLMIKDPNGDPVSGAVAEAAGSLSERSGEAGRITLELPTDADEMQVAAAGYRARAISADLVGQQPLEVKLERTTRLEIIVGPKPLSWALRVRIVADEPPLHESRSTFKRVYKAAGGGDLDRFEAGPGEHAIGRSHLAQGRVLVTDLKPWVSLKVELQDSLKTVILSQGVRLRPGEWRSVEFKMPERPRTLRGAVRDPDGQFLADALVSIQRDGRMAWRIPTRAGGRFEIPGLWGRSVPLHVKKEGFAPFFDPAFPLHDDPKTRTEVVLERPREVRLTVVDAAGQPLDGVDISVRQGPNAIGGAITKDGVAVARGLPAERIVFRASFTASHHDLVHDASQPEARMVLPRAGSVTVSFPPVRVEGNLLLGVVSAKKPEPEYQAVRRAEDDTPQPLELKQILPGTYDLTLHAFDREAKRLRALTKTVAVKIVAGEAGAVSLMQR